MAAETLKIGRRSQERPGQPRASQHPVPKGGRPPFAVETMLRLHFLQQWFKLSDPAMEEALYDTALFREFAGLAMGSDHLPVETPSRASARCTSGERFCGLLGDEYVRSGPTSLLRGANRPPNDQNRDPVATF
jgi:hypothetical protein